MPLTARRTRRQERHEYMRKLVCVYMRVAGHGCRRREYVASGPCSQVAVVHAQGLVKRCMQSGQSRSTVEDETAAGGLTQRAGKTGRQPIKEQRRCVRES